MAEEPNPTPIPPTTPAQPVIAHVPPPTPPRVVLQSSSPSLQQPSADIQKQIDGAIKRIDDMAEGLKNQEDRIVKATEQVKELSDTTKSLASSTKDVQDQVKEQKNYIILGFFILVAMVASLIWSFTSEKVTADHEVMQSIDLLEAQLQYQVHATTTQP